MPELPEVETVRRGLEKLLLGRTILSLEVKVPKMIKTSYDSFLHDLPGQMIQAIRREWGMVRETRETVSEGEALEIVQYWIKYKRIKPEQIMVIEVPDICKPW